MRLTVSRWGFLTGNDSNRAPWLDVCLVPGSPAVYALFCSFSHSENKTESPCLWGGAKGESSADCLIGLWPQPLVCTSEMKGLPVPLLGSYFLCDKGSFKK